MPKRLHSGLVEAVAGAVSERGRAVGVVDKGALRSNGQISLTAISEVQNFCGFCFLIRYLPYKSGFRMCIAYVLIKLWTGRFWGAGVIFGDFLKISAILFQDFFSSSKN